MKLNPFARVSSVFVGLALVLLITCWHRSSATVPVGVVEQQIRAFGPSIAQKLQPTTTFDRVAQPIAGFRPRRDIPSAPAGLKPQEQQAWEAMARRDLAAQPAAFAPVFAEHYAQGTEVRGQGMTITLKPLGSTDASAQVENGKLVYHHAYPETDSLQVVREGGSEEFLLLHSPRAPPRFEYEISAASGVKNISLRDNVIHFTNARGQELQLETPWLVQSRSLAAVDDRRALAEAFSSDDDGHRPPLQTANSSSTVHWELTPAASGKTWPRIALVVNDASHLHYPVLIDPSWTTTLGQMTTARYQHTATLLNNGQVLVAGGTDSSNHASSSAELYNPATGTWATTGSLAAGRYGHTATLLPNGQVLVAGGQGSSSVLASAELYNPATGIWTTTGSLAAVRYGHTATLLPGGQVLVTGGFGAGGYLSSSELYNPATGTWTTTGSLVTRRYLHTANLLANGQVLVAAGQGASGYLASAELYNPATGTWNTTGSLVTGRVYHTATLLPSGQVLVAAGFNSGRLSSAELYNPATGVWTSTGSLATSRDYHTATLLPNGQVLVAGGYDSSSHASSTAEVYNPATGLWATTGSLATARSEDTATLLPGGQVLVAAGYGSSGNIASSELYDSSAGAWSATSSLASARYAHTATLLPNGKVLVVGGYNTSALSSAELYNPATGAWTATGSLSDAREYHTATLLPSGKVLAVGGYGSSAELSTAELYDPAAGTWTATGSLATARDSHTATLLPSGQVLVAAGYNSSAGFLSSAELYDPATGIWTTTGSLATVRYNHTATLLPSGQVLVAGGYGSPGYLSSAELYDPATGTWTATGSLATGRASHKATLLPSGQVLVAGGNGSSGKLSSAELYNPSTGAWITTGSLHAARAFHTATLLSSGQVLVAGGNDSSGSPFSAELYNPSTGAWTTTGSLTTGRLAHTATLLPSGQVLVAGGFHPGALSSAELFDLGLGYTSATQPVVNTITNSTISAGTAVSLTGTGFTGVSEASSGNNSSSPSNISVVQLQSLVNEQTLTLSLDSTQGFSATSFTSLPVTSFPRGYAFATMFVNGTPSVSQIVLYQQASQTITFAAIPDQTYGATVTLAATASSGLPITYTTTGAASISGTTLTFTGTGAASVTASQSGDGNYAAATAVTRSFNVSPAVLTYTATPVSQPYGSAIPAFAGSVTGFVYSENQSTATTGTAVFNTTATSASDAGGYAITGSGLSATNYTFTQATGNATALTITQTSQSITFPKILNHNTSDAPFNLAATASSGLTITYTVISGPAAVSGNMVTLTGSPGTVMIEADQAGGTDYTAASPMTQSFGVYGSQTITFPTVPAQTYANPNPTATLSATASSGLAVNYQITSGPATVSGGVVTFLGAGTVRIKATQSGNTSYGPATSVYQYVQVARGTQVITYHPQARDTTYPQPPITISASATSGQTVTITVSSGPATISGNQLTLTGTGTVDLKATVPSTANYFPATVDANFKVTAR